MWGSLCTLICVELTSNILYACSIIRTSSLRQRIRAVNDTSNGHIDSEVGDIYGFDWARSRTWSKCSAHRNSSSHRNVISCDIIFAASLIQILTRDNDIFIANGIPSFFGQRGGLVYEQFYFNSNWHTNKLPPSALGAPIGNALLVGGLWHEIPKITSEISAEDVINAGATGLTSTTNSPELIHKLRYAHVLPFHMLWMILSSWFAFRCLQLSAWNGWTSRKFLCNEKRRNDHEKLLIIMNWGKEVKTRRRPLHE